LAKVAQYRKWHMVARARGECKAGMEISHKGRKDALGGGGGVAICQSSEWRVIAYFVTV
jgi:hypothetical protein